MAVPRRERQRQTQRDRERERERDRDRKRDAGGDRGTKERQKQGNRKTTHDLPGPPDSQFWGVSQFFFINWSPSDHFTKLDCTLIFKALF